MDDCIFCKIIEGQIPCHKVCEDEYTISFLDINPATKGHTLVVPKEHGEFITDLDDDVLSELLKSVKKTMAILDEKLQPEGFNVGWNHAQAAGQSVKHVHLHVLPRWKNDNGGSMHSVVKMDSDVQEVAQLF